MKASETPYNRILLRLKRHPVSAIILILGLSVIGFATFTNAVDDVLSFFNKHFSTSVARTNPPNETLSQINTIRKSRLDILRNGSPLKLKSQISDTGKSAIVVLFFDDTIDRLLAIPLGYEPGFSLSADCILEKHMSGRVDLLTNTGRQYLFDFYTIEKSYAKHFTLPKSAYQERAGNYTALASLETASGTTDTATLELDVRAPTQGNSIPTVELSPIGTVFSDSRYSQQVYGSDADRDKLSYFFLQNPRWLTINRRTGYVTGIAPKVDGSYMFVYTVRVSDGKDFALKTFAFTVYNQPEQ